MVAVKQGRVHPLLQIADLPADRCFRDTELPRCLLKTLVAAGGFEGAQGSKGQETSLHFGQPEVVCPRCNGRLWGVVASPTFGTGKQRRSSMLNALEFI